MRPSLADREPRSPGSRAIVLAAALVIAAAGLAVATAGEGPATEPWKAPEAAAQIQNPLSFNPENLAAGQKVYEKRCLNCHGDKGKGDGRGAAFMQVKPSDLTAEAVRAQSDGELFWKITTGRKPMPDFAGKLDDDQRWQTVLYVRALAEAADAERPAAGNAAEPPDAKATPTP